MHDREYRAGEVGRKIPALVQVAQETAQCRGDQLGASPAEALSLTQHELVGAPGGQPLQCDRPSAEPLGEKGAGNGQVVDDRCPAEATLVNEEAFVSVRDPIDWAIAIGLGGGGRDPAVLAQVVQQLPDRRGFPAPRSVSRSASLQESVHPLLVERFNAESFMQEPGPEMADGSKLELD